LIFWEKIDFAGQKLTRFLFNFLTVPELSTKSQTGEDEKPVSVFLVLGLESEAANYGTNS